MKSNGSNHITLKWDKGNLRARHIVDCRSQRRRQDLEIGYDLDQYKREG